MMTSSKTAVASANVPLSLGAQVLRMQQRGGKANGGTLDRNCTVHLEKERALV